MKIIVMTKHNRHTDDEVRVFEHSEENVAKVKKEMETHQNNESFWTHCVKENQMIYTLELYGNCGEAPQEITLRIFNDKEERDTYVNEFTKDDGANYRHFVDMKDNETIKV